MNPEKVNSRLSNYREKQMENAFLDNWLQYCSFSVDVRMRKIETQQIRKT